MVLLNKNYLILSIFHIHYDITQLEIWLGLQIMSESFVTLLFIDMNCGCGIMSNE